jgi:hypothetical protein
VWGPAARRRCWCSMALLVAATPLRCQNHEGGHLLALL